MPCSARLVASITACLVLAPWSIGCQASGPDASPSAGPSLPMAGPSAAPARLPGTRRPVSSPYGEREHALWRAVVTPYLADAQWSPEFAYDAGHFLMLPLHAAFRADEPEWRAELAAFFRRCAEAGGPVIESKGTRLQFLYLMSRFVVLARMHGEEALVPGALVQQLRASVRASWAEEPAFMWSTKPFAGGIRERLAWKLDPQPRARHYFRALIDEDLFMLALGADLAAYDRLGGEAPAAPQDEIVAVADRAFEQEGREQAGGGWLLQPGVFDDHADYAYAGQPTKVPGMAKAPRPGVATDSSHSFRHAAWLGSLAAAHEPGSPAHVQHLARRTGLGRQWLDRVLVAPGTDFPGYRLTNYMDGHNGVYRWEYATQGEGAGYGPYELSGSLLMGWWSLLETAEVRRVYQGLATRFPLSDAELSLYRGPGTSRAMHPLVAEGVSFTNGFRELIVRLAAQLPSGD